MTVRKDTPLVDQSGKVTQYGYSAINGLAARIADLEAKLAAAAAAETLDAVREALR